MLINEIYCQPTYQGEGPDIGKPCLFIRTQGCPVQCPGCDTAQTWNGSEAGTQMGIDSIRKTVLTSLSNYPGCGIVVSGGEPLIHYQNTAWTDLLAEFRRKADWLTLETSGFIGPNPIKSEERTHLFEYLKSFTRVVCSPKITPCLRSPKWTDEQIDCNLPNIIRAVSHDRLAFKYVVRDDADVAAVKAHIDKHFITGLGHAVYLMPYGITEAEVKQGCDYLLPICAKEGFRLSPRLHTLLWGNKRGV